MKHDHNSTSIALVALFALAPFGANTASIPSTSTGYGHASVRGDADFAEPVPGDRGEQIYEHICAVCHEHGLDRAPSRTLLALMSPESVYRALATGVMRSEAQGLSDTDKRAIAQYVTQSQFGARDDHLMPPACSRRAAAFDLAAAATFTGWGLSPEGTHAVADSTAGISPSDIARLKLKWVLGFSNSIRARSEPALAAGAIFVGSQNGTVYALDRASGCARWLFYADAEVRTGIVVSPWTATDADPSPKLYFGDLTGNVYAVSLKAGKLVWRDRPDADPHATITGTPTLSGDLLYVPVSSVEEASTSAHTVCCKFRGSVVAYDARTGKRIWQTYAIPEAPRLQGRNAAGTVQYGPSGAAIWNSPAIDVRRRQLYVATGDNYSSPAGATSDAVIAMDLMTGRVKWVFQATPADAWNAGCLGPDRTLCPKEDGHDFDFGAGVILARAGAGREFVVAGQKSGAVFALDPDTGRLVWTRKLGRGGLLGGVHFGIAASAGRLFIPISDADDTQPHSEPPHPGLYALDISSGALLWQSPDSKATCRGRPFCSAGISSAITATPQLVFAGGDDGWLRIYYATNGRILWRFDTTRAFRTTGGGMASGGSMSGGTAPIPFHGMLIANSGYGFERKAPGNVMLVFELH